MPEGQFLGDRVRAVYTDDAGENYLLTIDSTLVVTNSGLVLYDPGLGTEVCASPANFDPRGVWWQATATGFEGKRKFLICGTNDAALYASNAPFDLTIDGVAGTTTGRRGEQLSF